MTTDTQSKFKSVLYLSAEKKAKSGKMYRGVARISDDGKFNWEREMCAFVCKNGGLSIVDTSGK